MTWKHTGGWATPDDLAVPDANSTANLTMRDVIGNKDDAHLSNTIFGRVDELYDNFQSERLVYPTLAAGATVISPAGVWAYGNYADVIPANVITRQFHVHSVSVESVSVAAGVFQLELYKGATNAIISAVRFSVVGGFWGNSVYVVGSGEVDANAVVRARLASSVGAATITVSVTYFQHG